MVFCVIRQDAATIERLHHSDQACSRCAHFSGTLSSGLLELCCTSVDYRLRERLTLSSCSFGLLWDSELEYAVFQRYWKKVCD